MSSQSENIAEKYQGVIRALIPFASRGKLQEGLNKFVGRIDKPDLEEIKYEINRLISPCSRDASSKEFAQGPTTVKSVGKVKVELDEVGYRILKEEMRQHNNVFSEGVHEAISSKVRYDAQIAKESRKRVNEAFSVNCQEGQLTFPADKLKMVPDFQIHCDALDRGTPQAFHFLSSREFAITTSRRPTISAGETLEFTFPHLDGVTRGPTNIEYECKGATSLGGKNNYALHFKLNGSEKWAAKLEQYLLANQETQALVVEQEEQRTHQALVSDSLTRNMPMQAFLCKQEHDMLVPRYALLSVSPEERPEPMLSTCSTALRQLSREVLKLSETYQFQFTQEKAGITFKYVACLGQLKRDKLLASFIAQGQQLGTLRVIRVSIADASETNITETLSRLEEAVIKRCDGYSRVLFVNDVSHELEHFQIHAEKIKSFIAEPYRETEDKIDVKLSMPPCYDRRQHTRYAVSAVADLKLGWFRKTTAQMLDISQTGLCVMLPEKPPVLPDVVTIKIDQLNMGSLTYQVVHYDANSGLAHLAISPKHAAKKSLLFGDILAKNFDYFNQHARNVRDEQLFNYFWAFTSASIPGVQILLAKGEDVYQQLLVAKTDGKAKSVIPFKMKDGVLQTQGWLADKVNADVTSSRLNRFTDQSSAIERTLFFVRQARASYVTLEDDMFAQTDKRQKLHNAIKDKKGVMIAHSLQSNPYLPLDPYWYQLRCEKLSKVDKLGYNRLLKREQKCSRMLSIVPVSLLHQNILLVGSFTSGPEKTPGKPSLSEAG